MSDNGILSEIECWNCHEPIEPDAVRYEFPGRHVYWHECADGVLTQVNVEIKKVFRRQVPDWVRMPTAKDQYKKTLKLVYSDKNMNEGEGD